MKPIFIFFTAALLFTSCTRIDKLESRLNDLRPALGEVMGVVQQHHAKLYYAATAENWPLADYELGELKEGLESAVTLYPHFKDVKVPLTEALKIMDSSVHEVDAAIKAKSKIAFLKSHTTLTNSCNACHQAAERGFVVIITPIPGEFSNQRFTP